MIGKNLILLSKRAYTVAAENIQVQAMASAIRKGSPESSKVVENKKKESEVFWMRDPKTGNFIPENHFDEVDAAELREKLLLKKQIT